ncbi:MAG: hypothetical protein QXP53_00360 [Candidatus Pacearchaeota archaeon]
MLKLNKIFKKRKEEKEVVWGSDVSVLKASMPGKSKSTEIENSNPTETPLGFLSNFASAASSEGTSNVTTGHIEKIERLDRRLDRMIERLELLERKIERIENRLDLKY